MWKGDIIIRWSLPRTAMMASDWRFFFTWLTWLCGYKVTFFRRGILGETRENRLKGWAFRFCYKYSNVLNSPWDICHLTFVKIYDLGVWTAQYRVVDNRFFEYSFETVAPIALVLGTYLVAVTDWWSHASIYERTDMFTDTIFVQHYSLWMRIDAIPCQQNLHWS